MNMIETIKNDVQSFLRTRCNITATHIHQHAKDEKQALYKRAYPVVSIITGDERFENNNSYEVRGTRTIPIEIRIWETTEKKAMDIAEKVLSKLPTSWRYEGNDGSIDIIGVTHSDHIANMTEYYACFITIDFSMQVIQKT